MKGKPWPIERKYRFRQIKAYRRIKKRASLFTDDFFQDCVLSNPEYYGELLDPATFPIHKPKRKHGKKKPQTIWIEQGAIKIMEQARGIGWGNLLPILHERAMRVRRLRIAQAILNGHRSPAPLFED